MSRVYNFSAGPAVLPVEVLQEAADEMLDYRGTGMSVMEMSHRSKAFDNIIKEAEADLRKLMNIPDNYKVLFLQGGASQQFAMIPMNFMKNRKAGYILTGQWAKKAFSEAKIFGEAVELAHQQTKHLHIFRTAVTCRLRMIWIMCIFVKTTQFMVQKYHTLPNTKGKLLIADQSSCFLSEPVDVTKWYDLCWCTENVGPAGTVIAIIKRRSDHR